MISAMLQYIQRSPDCFHAVEELRQRLLREGYTELRPGRWQLTAGGKYFTTKNGSSMMAFRLPQEAPAGFLLTASHSDSPCFRLRDHAELTGEYIRLSAERYGGMINDSWLDRPLSVAGRVLVRREDGLEARLVDLKRDVALIPRVAIHLNRETNSGVKYDPARDLVALYAAGTGSGSFYREVARTADCAPEDVAAGDLVLYNNQPGTVWGAEGEFVSAPRLDDLACVFACAEGFLTAQERDMVPVLCVLTTRRSAPRPSRAQLLPSCRKPFRPSWTLWDLRTATIGGWWPTASCCPVTTVMPVTPTIRSWRTPTRPRCSTAAWW